MSKILDDYAKIAGQKVIDQLLQLAKPLKNIKIVHVNSCLLYTSPSPRD